MVETVRTAGTTTAVERSRALVRREGSDGMVRLTLTRGDRYNPLSREMIAALQAELDAVAGDPTARVLSGEEQQLVSPDAFGYLLSLAAEGRLDAEQIERIMRRVGQSEGPVSLRDVQDMVWREATGEPESETDLGNEQTTVH